jgi:hypothetical protein
MLSLDAAIKRAFSRKQVPAFQRGSIHDLALKLGLPGNSSVQEIIKKLDELPPQSVTFDSGTLVSGYVHGSVQFYMQSDGATAFVGDVHESGAVGENFVFAVHLLDLADASGRSIVFAHQDTVVGQLNIGFSEKNWRDYGSNSFIADQWEAAKNSRIKAVLHASTNPFNLVETVAAGLGIAAASIFLGTQVRICGDKAEWKCGWRPSGSPSSTPLMPGDPNKPPPGIGLEYHCECQW